MVQERSALDRQTAEEATGFGLQTHNDSIAAFEKVVLPPPQWIDMRRVLVELRMIAAKLEFSDKTRIANALSDIEAELQNARPDVDEIGSSLARFLKFVTKAPDYPTIAKWLRTIIVGAVSWLGANWHSLLNAIGLSAE